MANKALSIPLFHVGGLRSRKRLLNEPGSYLARVIDAIGKKNGASAPPEAPAAPEAASSEPAPETPAAPAAPSEG